MWGQRGWGPRGPGHIRAQPEQIPGTKPDPTHLGPFTWPGSRPRGAAGLSGGPSWGSEHLQVGSVPAAPGSNETGGKQRTLLGSPGYAPGHSRSGRTSLARPRAPHRASRAMRVEGCSRAPNTAAVTEPHEFTFGAALFIKYRKQSRKHPTGATAARLRWVPGARRAQPGPTHEQPLHPAARSRGAESVGHGQPESPEASYARRLSSRRASGKSPASHGTENREPFRSPCWVLVLPGAAPCKSPPAYPEGSAVALGPRGGGRESLPSSRPRRISEETSGDGQP